MASQTPVAARSTASSDGGKVDAKLPDAAVHSAALEGAYDPAKYVLAPDGTLVGLDVTGLELVGTAPPAGIPQRGGKVWNRDDWLPMQGEAFSSYAFRLFYEGHTVFDAFLLIACGQVGQVMLTNPGALYNTGLVAGIIPWVWSLVVGLWTVWNYISLYLEYKRDKIRDGSWWETNGKHRYVVQWFEVAGHHLGTWAKWSSMPIVIFATSGTCIVQTVASANSMYTIDNTRSKREWSLIFGGSMFLLVVFIPRFTKFRLVSIIGIIGTCYAAIFAIDEARKVGPADSADINLYPVTGAMREGTTQPQNWFNGISILIGEAGAHSFIVESFESMENPRHYKLSYLFGISYIIFITFPHAIAVNLSAYAPQLIDTQNMFGLFPVTRVKKAAVILMIIHHYVAYMLYGTQVCIAWEKICQVHTSAYWKRCLIRVPLACLWFFLALVLPFYGAINSLMGSLGDTVVGFTLLAWASNKVYATKERRELAVFPPFKWLQWKDWILIKVMNWHIAIYYFGFAILSLYYAILSIQQSYSSWGFLPECYKCK